MNLILAVIVQRAAEARETDRELKHADEKRTRIREKLELLRLCALSDEDENGVLSLDELLAAYDSLPHFGQRMSMLGVCRSDLTTLFHVLDEDDSGEVGYLEFVDNIYGVDHKNDPVLVNTFQFAADDMMEKAAEISTKMKYSRCESARNASMVKSFEAKLDFLCDARIAVQKEVHSRGPNGKKKWPVCLKVKPKHDCRLFYR